MAKLAPKRLRCVRQLPDGRGRGIGKQSASQKAGGWSDGVHSSSEPCRSQAGYGSRAFISMQLAPASRDEEGGVQRGIALSSSWRDPARPTVPPYI
ncbi:hypothetical protein IG631_00738 [Alternaria alternata]|nr:hypothetical protein IG631_00738 [Alternaria alternata]